MKIAGIEVIGGIVSKVINDPSQIVSGMKQILFFYRLLPDEWKKKAYWVFSKLWLKKKVVMSTNPEQPASIYEVTFEDEKLDNLYKLLPKADQIIMLQGKSMLDLISKGLHGDSNETKSEVIERNGQRGLNIVNMLTTNDIQYLLDELAEPLDAKVCEKKFNEWASDYDSIALLVSPDELSNPTSIKTNVKGIAKLTKKDYAIVNLSGSSEDCTNLLQVIISIKENKEINYKSLDHDIYESGFCKSIRIKINF